LYQHLIQQTVDNTKLIEELETFGRKLKLLWHFRNDESDNPNPFLPKSKFNSKSKDAAIEIYLLRLEEDKVILSNLTREE